MEFRVWILQNWFHLCSTVGIIGSLCYTAVAARKETKARQVSILFTLMENHQRLWRDFYQQPDLARILDDGADVKKQKISQKEREFVILMVQHLYSAFRAMKNGLLPTTKGIRRDVWEFFTLPIPWAVWEYVNVVQDADFVEFVESCLHPE